MIEEERLIQPFAQFALAIDLNRQVFNASPRYFWRLHMSNFSYVIATGYGHSIEDALSLAGRAIIEYYTSPEKRTLYTSVAPIHKVVENLELQESATDIAQDTTRSDGDFWDRLNNRE